MEEDEKEKTAEGAECTKIVPITIDITMRQATECGRCLRLGFDE
jgi:hypothetical protein